MRWFFGLLIAAAFTVPSQMNYNANVTTSASRKISDKLGDVVAAADFTGVDACAKINNAIQNGLPSTGGIVNATMLTGAQACASDPLSGVTKPVFLKLGVATYSMTASWQFNTPGIAIAGSSRSGSIGGFGTVLKWTGASGGGPMIKVINNAGNYPTISDLSFDGNALANVCLHVEVLDGGSIKHPNLQRLEFYGYRTRGLVLGVDDTATLRQGQLEVATAIDLTFRGGGVAGTIGLLHNAQNDEHLNCLSCYFDPNPALYFNHTYAVYNKAGVINFFGLSTTRSDTASLYAYDTINVYNWRSEDNVLYDSAHVPFDAPQVMHSVFQNNFQAPAIATVGTAGSTTWAYQVVAKNGATVIATSLPGTKTTGNATLNGTNYNTLTWAAPPVGSGFTYDIYRTSAGGTPSTTGLISSAVAGLTYNDQGAAGNSAAVAAADVIKININSTPTSLNDITLGGNVIITGTDTVNLSMHGIYYAAGSTVYSGPQNQTTIEEDAFTARLILKGASPALRLRNQSDNTIDLTMNGSQQFSANTSIVVPGIGSNFGFGVGTSGALVAPIQVDQGAGSAVGALFRNANANDINVFLDAGAANQALLFFRAAGAKRWELGKNWSGSNNDFKLSRDTGSAGSETTTDVVSITNANGIFTHLSGMVTTRTVLTYSTTIATNASLGNSFSITATDGVAFTISDPTNPTTGQRITYVIRNTSGGAMGAITWGGTFKQPAFTAPATANSRSREFLYDGTNWVMVTQTNVDVPN